MNRAAPHPQDTRAKGWRFEVDMEQVRQSDTWAVAGAALRPWLLMLWAVAWEQVPCGSLPNDDELIAARLEMPIEAFQAAKAKLMRGWWLADDGRLYQDTIVDRVNAMLEKRQKDAHRTAKARASRSNQPQSTPQDGRDGHEHVTRDTDVTNTGNMGEFDTKHQAPSTKHQINAFKASESTSNEAAADAIAVRARAPLYTAAMRTAGFNPAKLSADDPRLLKAIEDGATVDLVEAVAREAIKGNKGAPWVYAVVAGRLADARASPQPRGRQPPPQSTAERNAEAKRLLGFPDDNVIDA